MSILLMTRPIVAAERFVSALPERVLAKWEPVFSPLMDIQPLHPTHVNDGFSGVVFSSANAVPHALRIGVTNNVPAYCVGPATTQAAENAGWNAKCAGQDANALISGVLGGSVAGPLMHVRGKHTRGDIAQRLTQGGIPCDEVIAYDQTLLPLTEEAMGILSSGTPTIAPIFSPRTARHFVGQAPERAKIHLVALSPSVAEPLNQLRFSDILVAERPNAEAMIAAVLTACDASQRVEGPSSAQ